MTVWKTVALSEVATLNPTRPRELLRLSDSHEVTFVPMPAVNQYKGSIDDGQIRPFGEVRKGFTYFADDDVIFAKITPCMQNGKSAIAQGLVNGLGFGSTEFHVIRPNKDRILPEWVWHFVRQVSFRMEGTRHFRGAVGQQRVPADYLANANIPLPPLPEQRRIVARITECMERLDEIRQLREIADHEAVQLPRSYYKDLYLSLLAKTNGVPFGSTGSFQGGGTPSKQNASYWKGDIPWVSPKDMKVRDIYASTDKISPSALAGSAVKLIPAPSVLFVVRGMILIHTVPIAISRVPLTINQDMKAVTPNENFIAEYLATMLRGAEQKLLAQIEVAGHGTRRLQTEVWSSLPIPQLSIPDQRALVLRVQDAESLMDSMRSESPAEQVNLLRESVLRTAFAGEL